MYVFQFSMNEMFSLNDKFGENNSSCILNITTMKTRITITHLKILRLKYNIVKRSTMYDVFFGKLIQ